MSNEEIIQVIIILTSLILIIGIIVFILIIWIRFLCKKMSLWGENTGKYIKNLSNKDHKKSK